MGLGGTCVSAMRDAENESDLGFGIFPSVFAAPELSAVLEEASNEATRSRAGARHLLHLASVRALAEDSRLIGIAAQFIGGRPIPYKATWFDKSPDSNWLVTWHQDTALPMQSKVEVEGWGPWSVKAGQPYALAPADVLSRVIALRVHIDDSSEDNGPLRVLPNSHALGRLSDERIARAAEETRATGCLVDAGGVIAMRPLVIHASSKSHSERPRRVLHIEYACNLNLGNGLCLATV